MLNILTIDLEEWFQVFFAEDIIEKRKWDLLESELFEAVDVIRKILDENSLKITFFTVAWLAKTPQSIKTIKEDGHEIASHGYWHQQLFKMSENEIKSDLSSSKNILEDTIGCSILGYRAPGFSIRSDMTWIFDIIKDEGYKYDSSYLYSSQNNVYRMENSLIEIPPNSLLFLGKKVPTCGGFFFRLCPLKLYMMYLRYLNDNESPLVFYTHSWEINPSKNRIRLPLKKYFIQYYNVNSVQTKFNKLIKNFQFLSAQEYLNTINFKI